MKMVTTNFMIIGGCGKNEQNEKIEMFDNKGCRKSLGAGQFTVGEAAVESKAPAATEAPVTQPPTTKSPVTQPPVATMAPNSPVTAASIEDVEATPVLQVVLNGYSVPAAEKNAAAKPAGNLRCRRA